MSGGEGADSGIQVLLSLFFMCNQSFFLILSQLAADGLGVKKLMVLFLKLVCNDFQASWLAVGKKVRQKKVQGNVIVCKGF